jgi:hypothetical protein
MRARACVRVRARAYVCVSDVRGGGGEEVCVWGGGGGGGHTDFNGEPQHGLVWVDFVLIAVEP